MAFGYQLLAIGFRGDGSWGMGDRSNFLNLKFLNFRGTRKRGKFTLVGAV